RSITWVSFALVAAGCSGGLGPLYSVATNGERYAGPHSATTALIASAAADTGCPPAQIRTQIIWGRPDHLLAEACGERLTYLAPAHQTDAALEFPLMLIGRVAIPHPTIPRAES